MAIRQDFDRERVPGLVCASCFPERARICEKGAWPQEKDGRALRQRTNNKIYFCLEKRRKEKF
jgi:hypothetical protein